MNYITKVPNTIFHEICISYEIQFMLISRILRAFETFSYQRPIVSLISERQQ